MGEVMVMERVLVLGVGAAAASSLVRAYLWRWLKMTLCVALEGLERVVTVDGTKAEDELERVLELELEVLLLVVLEGTLELLELLGRFSAVELEADIVLVLKRSTVVELEVDNVLVEVLAGR